jgi:hypothetical protein
MMSLRARVSLIRQRILLTLRYWFRLPIDDIKERQLALQFEHLEQVNQAQLKTMQSMAGLISQLDARLALYEKNIPRMRQLRQQYDREQQKLRMAGSSPERAQALSDGILAMPQMNGRPT